MDDLEKPPRTASGINWRRVIWIAVAFAAVAALLWYIQPGTQTKKSGGRYSTNGPMPVVAAVVKKGDIDVTRAALGTVTPLANVTVRTQINGQLQQIAFQEGQMV